MGILIIGLICFLLSTCASPPPKPQIEQLNMESKIRLMMIDFYVDTNIDQFKDESSQNTLSELATHAFIENLGRTNGFDIVHSHFSPDEQTGEETQPIQPSLDIDDTQSSTPTEENPEEAIGSDEEVEPTTTPEEETDAITEVPKPQPINEGEEFLPEIDLRIHELPLEQITSVAKEQNCSVLVKGSMRLTSHKQGYAKKDMINLELTLQIYDVETRQEVFNRMHKVALGLDTELPDTDEEPLEADVFKPYLNEGTAELINGYVRQLQKSRREHASEQEEVVPSTP